MRVEPGGRARHCAACQKHVIDLAQLSESAIRGVVALSPDGFCGRQTVMGGELVTAPEPAAMRSRWPLRIGLGGALVAGALATAACQPAAAAGPVPMLVADGDPTPTPTPVSDPQPQPQPEPIQVMAGGIRPTPPRFAGGELDFAQGSARLAKGELPKLDDIAAALNANPWMSVTIEAHVLGDEVSEARRAKLLQARAAVVKNALVKRGVPAERLTLATSPDNDKATVRLFASAPEID